jgi:hypothetical protein
VISETIGYIFYCAMMNEAFAVTVSVHSPVGFRRSRQDARHDECRWGTDLERCR